MAVWVVAQLMEGRMLKWIVMVGVGLGKGGGKAGRWARGERELLVKVSVYR